MASWQMRCMKTTRQKKKKKKKAKHFSFFIFPQINKSAALKQAWRKRHKETEKRWQGWGRERDRETEENNSSISSCYVCVWAPPSGRPSEHPALTCQPESAHSCVEETPKNKVRKVSGRKKSNKKTSKGLKKFLQWDRNTRAVRNLLVTIQVFLSVGRPFLCLTTERFHMVMTTC